MHAAGKAAGPALARLAGEQDACSHPAQVLRQAIVVLGKHLPECPAARRLFLRLIARYLPPPAVQPQVFRQSVPAARLAALTATWDGYRQVRSLQHMGSELLFGWLTSVGALSSLRLP